MRTYVLKADSIQSLLSELAPGSHVYVGVDVHARTWSFCVLGPDGAVLLKRQTDASEGQVEALAELLSGLRVQACYEAGPTGYGLLRMMRERGWDAIVVPPSSVRQSAADKRVKTDRRDARRLAEELRAGHLWSIAELPEQQVRDRQLLRTVEQLASSARDLIRRIRSLCLFHGIEGPWASRKSGGLSAADVAWLRGKPTGDEALDLSLDTYAEAYTRLRSTEKKLWKKLDAIARRDYADDYLRLRRVPGISIKTAVTWVLEVPPLESFPNSDAFVSWLGLAPGERSSGEKQRRGGVGNTGNAAVRRVLIQVAGIVARSDPSLARFGARVRSHQHPNQARVAMAAKLARRLFQMCRHRQEYLPPAVEPAAA